MAEKKCKHCAMMIPKEAKICPHCRKKTGSFTGSFNIYYHLRFGYTYICNDASL